jgi:hypothetical protein
LRPLREPFAFFARTPLCGAGFLSKIPFVRNPINF